MHEDFNLNCKSKLNISCDFDVMPLGISFFGDIKGYNTHKQKYKRWSDVKKKDKISPYIAFQEVSKCPRRK